VDGLDYNAIAQIGQQGAFEHYRYSGQKHKSFLFRCCACAGQPLNTLVSEETGDCRSYLFGSLEWRKVSDPIDGLERGVRYQGKQCLTQGGLFLDLSADPTITHTGTVMEAACSETSRAIPCESHATFAASAPPSAIADPDGLPVAIRKAALSLIGSQ
jgi:hypothetical protein